MMANLSEIREKFAFLHSIAKTNQSPRNFQTSWYTMFGTPISPANTEYFLQYYRGMKHSRVARNASKKAYRKAHRKTYRKDHRKAHRKSQRKSLRRQGGSYALTGAPLSYGMVPGTTADVYGYFPTDISTDPQSIQNLDQFYGSALTRGCGLENSTRQVPASMGSNLVGGKRRKTRKALKGGNLFESLSSRFYTAEPVPGSIQKASDMFAGQPSYPSASPAVPNWSYSDFKGSVIQPSLITQIEPNFMKFANPAPYTSGQIA